MKTNFGSMVTYEKDLPYTKSRSMNTKFGLTNLGVLEYSGENVTNTC